MSAQAAATLQTVAAITPGWSLACAGATLAVPRASRSLTDGPSNWRCRAFCARAWSDACTGAGLSVGLGAVRWLTGALA